MAAKRGSIKARAGPQSFPLARVAGWHTLGILIGAWVAASAWVWLGAGALAAVSGWVWPRLRQNALIGVLLLAGAANLRGRLEPISPHDLRRVAGTNSFIATVRGRLMVPPSLRVSDRDGLQLTRSIARIEATEWRRLDKWEPLAGSVMVTTPGVLEGIFFKGERVEVSGVLSPPKQALAPGVFDYSRFLRWQGVSHLLRVDTTNEWQRVESPSGAPLTEQFVTWGRKVLARGLPDDEATKLLWAMVLGWQTGLTGEVAEPFIRSGTLHIFAISGSHIAALLGFLVIGFSVIGLPRHRCAAAIIPLIWFYTAATGWQPSAIRATLMATVWLMGWFLKRPINPLNTLLASALILLLWDPAQLFQVSFQLSFTAVLGFVLLLPFFTWIEEGGLWGRVLDGEKIPGWRIRLCEWVDWVFLIHWRQGDIFLAPALRENIRPAQPIWIRAHFLPTLAASVIATIATLPLIAHYFHLFNPISVFSNLIVVPLSGVVLASGFLSLGAAWGPGASEVFNHAGWAVMWVMIRVSERLAGVSWGSRFVADWGWPLMACYFAGLAGVGFQSLRLRWRWWAGPWLACGIALFALRQWSLREPTLTILPGAAGVAHAHRLGQPEDWLLDAGNEVAARILVQPYLQAQGVNAVSALLLSHGDAQHVDGAPLLAEAFSIGEIGLADVSFRSTSYRRALAQLAWDEPVWRELGRGADWRGWTVLHPEAGEKQARADDKAIVLRGVWQGWTVLLVSDLGRIGQRMLMQREPNLQADVLIGGIPENNEPFGPEFLSAVRPNLIVVASGEIPAHARGSRRLRERLARQPAPVWFTVDTGAVILQFGSRQLTARAMNGAETILKR